MGEPVSAWMLAEEIEDGDVESVDTHGPICSARLRNGDTWYRCSSQLWRLRAWPRVAFQVRGDRVVGLRNADGLDSTEAGGGK